MLIGRLFFCFVLEYVALELLVFFLVWVFVGSVRCGGGGRGDIFTLCFIFLGFLG